MTLHLISPFKQWQTVLPVFLKYNNYYCNLFLLNSNFTSFMTHHNLIETSWEWKDGLKHTSQTKTSPLKEDACKPAVMWRKYDNFIQQTLKKKKTQRFDIQIIDCQHKVILFPWQKDFWHKFSHMTDHRWKIERERSFKYSVILLFFPITLEIIFPELSTFYTHNVNKMLTLLFTKMVVNSSD